MCDVPYRQTERSRRVRAAARGRILQAARRLFARRGYAATTVQDVVDAAKTSVGNFYFYFENKGALLRSVLEDALAAAWGRGDELMANAPAGPARLAVMVYANAMGLLVIDKDLTRLMVGDDSDTSIRDRLVEINTPRVRAILRANFPDYPEDKLDLAVTAWAGTGRNCVLRAARGELGTDFRGVAEFATRWNLRGLGVREAEIDAAVAYADGVFAT
jgi:AcrR family transcriptional regulator